MEHLGQSIPTPSTMPPLEDHRREEARRRADGPVFEDDTTSKT